MEKKVCLTETEFNLLASGMGIEKLYAFSEIKDSLWTEQQINQQINQCLFKLVKKGLLQIEQEQYTMSAELFGIFTKLKEAEHVITIFTCGGKRPIQCLYTDSGNLSDAVSLELGNVVGSVYKLSQSRVDTALDEALTELSELTLLQESNIKSEDGEELSGVTGALGAVLNVQSDASEIQLEELCEKADIVCMITERNTEDEGITKRLFLRTCALYDEMILQTENKLTKWRYNKDQVIKLFLLQEKENSLW